MRKLLMTICCLVLLTSQAFAGISDNWNEISRKKLIIELDATKCTNVEGEEVITFYPAQGYVDLQVVAESGATKHMRRSAYLGTESETRYTNKEIYASLNTWAGDIKALMKSTYLEAINIDLSN